MHNIFMFKQELKQLLKKYNASIGFSCGGGSDTDGLYDEKIVINIDNKEITLCEGYAVGQSDL